jgi:hypothetical protein
VYFYLPAEALHYHLAQPHARKKHKSRDRRNNVHRTPHHPAINIYILYIYIYEAPGRGRQQGIYIYICLGIHIGVYICIYACVRVCACVCVWVCVCVCLCVCECVCVCVCVYLYTWKKQELKSRGLAECSCHTFKKNTNFAPLLSGWLLRHSYVLVTRFKMLGDSMKYMQLFELWNNNNSYIMFYSYDVILPQKCPQNLSSWIVVFVASHLCLRKISQKIKCSFWTPTKNLLERKKNKKSCILFKICSILITTLCIPDTHTQTHTHTHTHTHTLKLTHTHTPLSLKVTSAHKYMQYTEISKQSERLESRHWERETSLQYFVIF